jgi:hypothetical protein
MEKAMGLFTKKVSVAEYGGAVLYLAQGWVSNDALGALGRCFPDFDGSNGRPAFFESKGYSEQQMVLYLRLAYHISLQTMALQYDEPVRRELVIGAMSQFRTSLDGYDPVSTFGTLESAYSGEIVFDPEVQERSAPPKLAFLPQKYQTAPIINARFLMVEFIVPKFRDASLVADSFDMFASGLSVCVGVLERARTQVARQFKF